MPTRTLSHELNGAHDYLHALVKYYKGKLGIKSTPLSYEAKTALRGPLYHQPILYDQDGNDLIAELISQNCPLMVARLGATETLCLRYYLRYGGFVGGRGYFTWKRNQIRDEMTISSGFFPSTDDMLDKFSAAFLEHLADADLMAVWFNDYEHEICKRHCSKARLVELSCLEPFRFPRPWSRRLAGKRVLVVHPFAESIRKQYQEKRRLLFDDPSVLPDFELKTVKAVQSIVGTQVEFASWFDAFQRMCDQIQAMDFDTALIGAGAYGLPLASFVKRLGKQAIHMGGVTQILFGIRGRRWEVEYAGVPGFHFNEHWIRPSANETPERHVLMEQGAYW